jgi:hypothetical protein
MNLSHRLISPSPTMSALELHYGLKSDIAPCPKLPKPDSCAAANAAWRLRSIGKSPMERMSPVAREPAKR